MTEDEMKQHALEFAAIYTWLLEDTDNIKHDPDAHNVCSAVVESGSNKETYYAYSNLSALKAARFRRYNWVTGEEGGKLIRRGGYQDYHTEVRLINGLYAMGKLTQNTVVTFFSSRSVCTTCRLAIYTTMEMLAGSVAIMAFEFKVEKHGTVTENVYPIHMSSKQSHDSMDYTL